MTSLQNSGSSMLHTTTTTTTAAAANASWFSTDSPSVAARRSFVVKGRNRNVKKTSILNLSY